jgi:hypothetical protein
MELKDFITSTLVAISQGVEAARAVSNKIAPMCQFNDNKTASGLRTASHTPVGQVEFDVAVTVQDSSGTGVKAGIAVVSFISGATSTNLNTASQNSTISRVKFSVPISLTP